MFNSSKNYIATARDIVLVRDPSRVGGRGAPAPVYATEDGSGWPVVSGGPDLPELPKGVT